MNLDFQKKSFAWLMTLKCSPFSLLATLRLDQVSVVRCLCVVAALAPGSDPDDSQVPRGVKDPPSSGSEPC